MSWNVEYSESAQQDLRNIYEYVTFNLHSPKAAKGLTQRIMKTIHSLNDMPFRFPIYHDEPWHSRGLRFVTVDNYLVFYLPKEEVNILKIVRIMYGRRDIRNQFEMEEF